MDAGDRYRDLGGGVWDDGRPEPTEPPEMRPDGKMPPCPCCGLRESVTEFVSEHGRFDCRECMTLFDGGDLEWRRHRERREAAVKRRRERDGQTESNDE